MGAEIIGLHEWLETPPGSYLFAWEQARFDQAVADIFGYHALQLGLPEIDGLRGNRMPHRWLATSKSDRLLERPHGARAALVTDFTALPFPANSVDLVVLPHAMELGSDPHATLREVERVLVPEGRVVLSGFNPASLWGFRQRRTRLYRRFGFGELFLPETGELISHRRICDWLRLLSFEVESTHFGIYRPVVHSQAWLDRFKCFDVAGERWWPILGAVYFVVAVKRVRGMTLLAAEWKRKRTLATAPAPVAGRLHCQALDRDDGHS